MNDNKHKRSVILLVDDDPDIIEIVGYILGQEGYRVVFATNGVDAVEQAKKEVPDLIVMDLMMPRMDGMEAVSAIRKLPKLNHTMITFLSAAQEDFLQVAAYNAGADDYITKPIRPKLLVSRIKAMLRRQYMPAEVGISYESIAGFHVFPEEYRLLRDGRNISLTKKEFELFCLFASKPGKVFKRVDILNKLWSTEVVGKRTIDVHVLKLREKIGEEYFTSITGIGYKFDLPLSGDTLSKKGSSPKSEG
ncbi:response regulator transcription factor [uncultured Flavobacterium sp.]|uniref:response regulator transcription factor n=1 Tax=uncultured Flavobacterium sp. TaxID=165435 RepID=UPI0025FE0FB0|nr:response regulator transcription factor [uncultured Flavobacterium sp.]